MRLPKNDFGANLDLISIIKAPLHDYYIINTTNLIKTL